MARSLAWVGKARAELQQKTEEWNRKRTQENAVANLERERIRDILLGGPHKLGKTGGKNVQDLAARSPMTDFFLRE